MTEVQTNSTTNRSSKKVKNPAPHRGFNAKAREILIEPATKLFSNSIRYSSEQEIIASKTQKNLERTDSQLTNTSTKSHSSTQSYPKMAEDFDSFEDLPRCGKKAKKMLGDIGKTRSAGDLLKNSSKKPAPLIRTFQQLNIMKLPSVDSVTSDHSSSLTRLNNTGVGADPFLDEIVYRREKVYEMK